MPGAGAFGIVENAATGLTASDPKQSRRRGEVPFGIVPEPWSDPLHATRGRER